MNKKLTLFRIITLSIIALLFSSTSFAAINLERTKKTDKDGWYNETFLNTETLTGNSRAFSYSGRARVDNFYNKYHSFLVVGGEKGKSNGNVYKENYYGHLRGSRELTKSLSAELFTQFEHDKILDIKGRSQVGGGLVWDLIDRKLSEKRGFKLKYGTNLLYQSESHFSPLTPTRDTVRSANYLALSYNITDNTYLSGTSTIDFDIAEPRKDHTWKTVADLGIKIAENISFTTGIEYNYNSFPVAGVKNNDLKWRNGLSFYF